MKVNVIAEVLKLAIKIGVPVNEFFDAFEDAQDPGSGAGINCDAAHVLAVAAYSLAICTGEESTTTVARDAIRQLLEAGVDSDCGSPTSSTVSSQQTTGDSDSENDGTESASSTATDVKAPIRETQARKRARN